MHVAIDRPLLLAFLLALVRSTGFVVACPFFNGPWIPYRVRLGFAAAIALPLTSSVSRASVPDGVAPWLVAAVLQVLGGIALGLCVLFVFASVQAAGELIDLQVGFSYGGTVDPIGGVVATPVAKLLQMAGTAIVFASGGHVVVIRGFLRSVDAVPIGRIDLNRLDHHLLSLVGSVLVAAIEISLPLLAALFCSEVALGLLGKAAPQLNVLVMGFALKAGIALGLLSLTMAALPGATDSLIERGLRTGLSIFHP
jgi:flagellar biosynthetic protein FliR